ncbi:MAG: hypothetical protein KGY50_02335 [Candidatus Thermoplasmatota archaeon]|nr:hypothetical protein [Candidatus Thermoplasmatota archaeon]
MNEKIIAVFLVVVLMIAGGVLAFKFFQPVEEDNEQELPENSDIYGKYIVDLLVTFEDGTEQRVTEMEKSLSVYWQSQPIVSVEWILDVQVNTDGSLYDRAEFSFMDIADGNDFVLQLNAENTVEQTYNANSNDDRVLSLDDSKTLLWSKEIPLKQLLEDEEDGVYTVVFEAVYGAPKYRGLGENTSDWVTLSTLPVLSFDVEISSDEEEGTTDKDIEFDSDVIWS